MKSLPVFRSAGATLRDGGKAAVAGVGTVAEAVHATGKRIGRAGGHATAFVRERPLAALGIAAAAGAVAAALLALRRDRR
jgi:ElaB/YqjD/DUF883 family membrane-anchored ribosome-binding protein